MQGSRARSLAAIAALASLVLTGQVADAGKKKKKKKDGDGAAAAVGAPACGIDFLPLAQGRQWTYKFFVPENSTPPPGQLHVPEPESGLSSPHSMRMEVVLPLPFGPRKP